LLTGGQSDHTMELDHYEEAPARLQQKVIGQGKQEEETVSV